MMKEDICRAFCNEVHVKDVPIGLAVSTPFRRSDGDAVAFYVVRTDTAPGIARLEDDGQTMPYLEACGVDFETSTRRKAFEELLAEYGAEHDEDENVIRTSNMREEEIPRAALTFAALLLRLYDFLLLTQEHVESTFKEDATRRIKEVIGPRAVGEGVFLRRLLPREARQLLAGLSRMRWNPVPGYQVEWMPAHRAEPSAVNREPLPSELLWFDVEPSGAPLTVPHTTNR